MTNKEIIRRLEKMLLFAKGIPGPRGHQVAWAEADRLDLALGNMCTMLACIVRDMKREVVK